jgi:hypothetical protein
LLSSLFFLPSLPKKEHRERKNNKNPTIGSKSGWQQERWAVVVAVVVTVVVAVVVVVTIVG